MSLARFVRQVVGDYRYERRYGATVVATNTDGSRVDLEPDDDAVRGLGLQAVPVRSGIAGGSSRAQPGTRCLLAFDDGDPSKPAVVGWEYAKGSAVVSLGGGIAGVARNGDMVELLLSPLTPITGVISGSVTVPTVPPTVVPVPPITQFVGVATIVLPVRGRIVGGARRVKA